MLFKRKFLDGIASGEITVAFRRWTRPTVRAGGTLKTAAGVVAIDSLTRVTEPEITEDDARHAGYSSRRELMDELNARDQGELYRIDLHHAGADPRIALRQSDELSDEEVAALRQRLSRMGPWTLPVLRLIAENPGVRAGDLAPRVDQERAVFKPNVRKLKALGLTESLGTGYRLSPRGQALLTALEPAP
ncbi:MAG TPA: hypothetical protein VN493_24295 [Thermoanaerobaculia bacterium]|nr:hypothetical protein [Thermoanaerobaculia bacterium]